MSVRGDLRSTGRILAAAFAGAAAIALLRYSCVLARLLHKHQLCD
jgi:hypothetical protein